jgi:alkylhydroperoxidase family enzyme
MAWISWIQIEPDDTKNEVVEQLYNRTRDRTTGAPPDTVRLTSLTPQVAGLLHDLQLAIHHEAKGLTLREKEIAALLVSTYNGCVH